jgi:hypothetical protein
LIADQTHSSPARANLREKRWSVFGKFLFITSFGIFIGYYSLCSFKVPWLGDINKHVAAVHGLYEDFRQPMHEGMPVDGKYTEVYNPLIVAAAVGGKLFQLSAYGALQWVSVLNVIFYAYAVFTYFKTTSILPNSSLPPIFFVVFSLFLRNSTWTWASETSFNTLTLTQAYPAFLGWSLGLFIFAFVERLFTTGQRRNAVMVALLSCILILTHLITATWVLGIVGVRGIFELFRDGKRGSTDKKRTIISLAVSVFVGCGLAVLWPYGNLLDLRNYIRSREGSPFGSAPFSTMMWLYILAIPSLALVFVSPRPRFLLIGFLATLGAFCAFRIFHIDYGDRYVFFMAFFPQVLVAEIASVGVTSTLYRKTLSSGKLRIDVPRPLTPLFFLIAISGLIASFYAPPFRTARANGTFPGPLELQRRPNAEDAFYANYAALRPYLNKQNVVLLANTIEGYALAATTGARSVVVIFGFYVPDYTVRARDVKQFLSTGVSLIQRRAILERYHVSHILLLTEENANVVDEMKAQFGPALFEDAKLVLFKVEGNRK